MKANNRKKACWGLRRKDKEYSLYKKVFKRFMPHFRRHIIVMLNVFLGLIFIV